MRILVIEDDPLIGSSLVKGFTEAGHVCDAVRDGGSGLELARTQQADAIILDLMLPALNGKDLLGELRNEGVHTPVILLTAIGSIEDRINCLNAGADDYMTKPFDFAELLARVNAVVRRANHRPSLTITVGELTLNLSTRRVTRSGADVDLTPIEFSMMELLMRYAGQVVTRKMLCEHVWGFNWDGTTNVIEVHVNRLRGKLDKGREDSVIKTIRGRGYMMTAEAQ